MEKVSGGKFSRLESLCINVVKSGPVPRHIGIIMDGNRRYATNKGWNKTAGHRVGSKKFDETVDWCIALGIKELSWYTFSIDNFKRTEEEKDTLFKLIEEKLVDYLNKKDLLNKLQLRIRLFGEISYLPRRLQTLFAELILYTYRHDKITLNMCVAYSSREEMAKAAKEIALGVYNGYLQRSDITENLVTSTLCPTGSESLDVILRTSGEVRLSDFMLWEGCDALLGFVDTLWPELSLWRFLACILWYQRYSKDIEKLKQMSNVKGQDERDPTIPLRLKRFIEQLEGKRYRQLVEIKNGNTVENKPPSIE